MIKIKSFSYVDFKSKEKKKGDFVESYWLEKVLIGKENDFRFKMLDKENELRKEWELFLVSNEIFEKCVRIEKKIVERKIEGKKFFRSRENGYLYEVLEGGKCRRVNEGWKLNGENVSKVEIVRNYIRFEKKEEKKEEDVVSENGVIQFVNYKKIA